MANEISKETEKIREILAYQSCKEKKINQEGLKKIIDFNQKVAYVTKDDIEEEKTVSVDTIQNWYKQYIKKYYNEFSYKIYKVPVEDINRLWEVQVKRVEISTNKGVYIAFCCDVMDQYVLAVRVEKNPQDIRYLDLLKEALNNSGRFDNEHTVIHSNMNPYVNVEGVSELISRTNIHYKILNDYQGHRFYSNEVFKEILEKISNSEDMDRINVDIFREKFLQVTIIHNNYIADMNYWYLTKGQFRAIRQAIKGLAKNVNVTISERIQKLNRLTMNEK